MSVTKTVRIELTEEQYQRLLDILQGSDYCPPNFERLSIDEAECHTDGCRAHWDCFFKGEAINPKIVEGKEG
jgi:hypothetical protein